MAKISTITGCIRHLGAADHIHRPVVLTHYNTIRFEDQNGKDICLERVLVPDYLGSFFNKNLQGDFHILSVDYPQLIGRKTVHHLFGLTVGDKSFDGIQQIKETVKSSKFVTILQTFLLGLILLPFMGAGLLFWLWGLRTLMLTLPTTEMNSVLSKT